MKKRVLLSLIILACVTLSVFAQGAAEASAFPVRPLVMIVPFNPGGATDLLARKAQPKMEEILGKPIAVQNMAGGATAIGNQYVMDQAHDGHTLLAQPTDITSIAIMGQSKLTSDDWSFLGIAAAVPSVFVVHPDSKIKTIQDLVAVMKTKKLTAAVAASGCAWTRAIGLFADQLKLTLPQFVPSGGGYTAAVSAMKKEVDFAACGFAEAIELIKGGELRALAYWGVEPVTLPNGTVVPTFGSVYPALKTFEPFGGWVGMAVPKGVPADVLAKLINAYDVAIHQPDFIEFCKQSSFMFMGKIGADADAFAKLSTSVNAYLMYDLGFTPTDPATLGIQRVK